MEKPLKNGFTLIELIVAVAIMGILLGVGVPSFLNAVKNSRTNELVITMTRALYGARSEAIQTSTPVVVCARGTDTSCGKNWEKGALIFIDEAPQNPNSTGAVANIGAEDEIIAIEQLEPHDNNKISAVGSLDMTANTADSRAYIVYLSDGTTDWRNGFFTVCDERGPEKSRAVNVVLTGDVRKARPNGSEKIPRDVFGETICP